MKLYTFYLILISLAVQAGEASPGYISTYRDKISEAETFTDLKNTGYATPKGATVKVINQNNSSKWQYPNLIEPDELLGIKSKKLIQSRNILRNEKEIFYDAVYSTDEYSRRITEASPKVKYKKFLALFGCSFVFGIGLNDNQTLNSLITHKQSEYFAYNYGIPAVGTNVFLAQARSIDFKKEIPQASGAFVYVFFSAHVDRSLIKWPSLTWNAGTPYFKKDGEGKMQNAGNVLQSNPIWYYVLRTYGRLLNDSFLKNSVTPALNSRDYEYACRLVVAARDEFNRKAPDSKFIFFGHPFGGIDPVLEHCLVENGIKVHQGKLTRADRSDPQNIYHISFDRHPNETLNREFADQILDVVNQELK